MWGTPRPLSPRRYHTLSLLLSEICSQQLSCRFVLLSLLNDMLSVTLYSYFDGSMLHIARQPTHVVDPPDVGALDEHDVQSLMQLVTVLHDLPHLHAEPSAQHAVPLLHA